MVIAVVRSDDNSEESVTFSLIGYVPIGVALAKNVGIAPISSPLAAAAPISPKMLSLSRSHAKDRDSSGSGSLEDEASNCLEENMPTTYGPVARGIGGERSWPTTAAKSNRLSRLSQ